MHMIKIRLNVIKMRLNASVNTFCYVQVTLIKHQLELLQKAKAGQGQTPLAAIQAHKTFTPDHLRATHKVC